MQGRVRQKQRTRTALVAATRELIARSGRAPTVAEAAELASVSRTTAYRYFASQEELVLAAHPEIGATTMVPPGVPEEPEARFEATVRAFLAMIVDTEVQQRTMLRLSLERRDADQPLRQGRAIGWFAEALEPLAARLGPDGVRSTAVAVRAVAGIESLVWLTDVAGLSVEEAVEQMVWSAVAVLRRRLSQR